MKILVSQDGRVWAECSPTAAPDLSRFPSLHPGPSPFSPSLPQKPTSLPLLYLYPIATPCSIHTRFKTTRRGPYDAARRHAKLDDYSSLDEVMLLAADGEVDGGSVMDGSISSIYIFRDDRWTTPSETLGCQLGVTRRLALSNRWCIEGRISMLDVQLHEVIWASNALKGFYPLVYVGPRVE